jgi:hypothetical protein
MPTDAAVIIAGIILVFVTFVAVLAWGDYYSNAKRRSE